MGISVYFVTVEYEDDGCLFDDIEVYDSVEEAEAFASKKRVPKGVVMVIYAARIHRVIEREDNGI